MGNQKGPCLKSYLEIGRMISESGRDITLTGKKTLAFKHSIYTRYSRNIKVM